MSYKVRIEKVYSNVFVINNIGTETISIKLYTSSGETSSYFNPGGQYTIGSEKAAIFGSSDLIQVFGFIGNPYLTVFTKDGFITKNMSSGKVKLFECELVPFSAVPIPASDTCRLTSNRLSPPKFKLRKFFRVNPRKAMIGG